MKRLLRATEVLAWTAFFVFAALVLVLRFGVLPNIERFRGDIVSAVSRSIGQPVKIGAIEAGWLGLRPQVTFFDVRIYDASGREALVLPAVDNVVSWRSLLDRQLRVHSLAIDGPQLDVRRDASGALYVAGMKLSEGRGSGGFADWLLSQEEIVVRNAAIQWHDEKRGAPTLALSGVDLRLRNSGNAHSIGFAARPPAALGATLDVRAELTGRSVSELSAWNGRLYVELGATDLAGWRPWIDYPVDLQQGEGALRLWATLEQGHPRQATVDVELARVAALLGKGLRPLELSSLRGRLQVREREGGYELAGKRLALAMERGPALSPADFRVGWRPADKQGAERGSVIANLIELEPFAHLAESLPFPAEARKLLAELAPRGRVLDAKLEWTGELAKPAQFSAQGRFAELAMRAHGKLPGFAGLSGTLEANEARGSVRLAARKAELELPQLLSQPRVPLESLNGQIEWVQRAERTAITIASLGFSNEHLEGKAHGSYLYTGEGPGVADLTVQVSRADGRYTARYLPSPALMGPGLHAWLANAVHAGQASDVNLRLKGDLRDFPFRDASKGKFQVTARVERGVLDYAAGWPRIYDIDAELAVEGERMDITARSATVLGAKLSAVHAAIPRLAPGAQLSVTGQAEGPTSEFLKYVDASPLRRMAGGVTDTMSASGRGKLRLRLDLPLANLPTTKVSGDYEVSANTVKVNAQLPPLERVTGTVSFNESSFTLQDLRARLFEGGVTITGGSRPGLGVEVVAKGDATVAALRPIFNHPWRRHLGGSAGYTATVTVREGRTRIALESSLRGVSSVLPAPLAKGAAETLPLRVDILPVEGGARDRVSLTLGKVATAEFLRRRQGEAMVVQRAGISLTPGADQAVRLPERPGTLLYGSLAALDFDRWQPFIAGEEGGNGGGGTDAPATALDLKIGTLDAYGKRLHDVALRAGADAAGWSATVQAAELAGDLSFRGEKGGRLIARLTHFTMPEDYPGAKPRDPSAAKQLPSVDLATERFAYRGKQFGRVELVAQRAGESWRVDKMTMVNPESSLSAHGVWLTAPASQTSLSFELETSDGGKFLERIGYPHLVRGGKAKMQGAVAWAGEPTTPDYPSLTGDVKMDAENGQFLEIEPGIGKLISLMSLQALPRRLSLDFRDVFSKGFQFDRINSTAHIERGMMVLKEFKMRGSAADVDMRGEVDLAKETQNLNVRVIPSLGDSASTVLAFLNPLLVFPAALAQKILKDPLGHIFAFDYAITGPWSDPKVAKTRVAAEPAVPQSQDR